MLVSVFLSARTLSRVAFGILAKASLVGAKTVIPSAEFSESTRPAFFTSVTRVDSSGLPEAAVATGTLPIASKLPAFAGSVGTAAQPGPKLTIESIGAAELGAAAAEA